MRRFDRETGKQLFTHSQQPTSSGSSEYKGDAFRLNRFRRMTEVNSEPVSWSESACYIKDHNGTFLPDPLNLSGYYRVVHSSKMLLDSILHTCYPHAKPILALLPKTDDCNLTAVLRDHIDSIGALVVNNPDEDKARNISDFCSAWGESSVCVTSQNVTDFECDINLFDLIVFDESEYEQNQLPINALWHALKPGGLFIYIERSHAAVQLPFTQLKAQQENAVFEDLSEIAKSHPSLYLFENSLSVENKKGCRTQFSVIRKMEATATEKIPALSLPELVPIDGEASVSKLSVFLKDHHLNFGIFKEGNIVSMTELVSHISTGAAHWNIVQPGLTVLTGELDDPVPSFDLALHPYFDGRECETIEISDQDLQKLISEDVLPTEQDGNYILTWYDQKIGLIVIRDKKLANNIPQRWKDAAGNMNFDVPFLKY